MTPILKMSDGRERKYRMKALLNEKYETKDLGILAMD